MAPKSSSKRSSTKSIHVKSESRSDRNYFSLPHPFWMLLISFGLWLLGASTFAPHTIPEFLGPIGRFGVYMSQFHNSLVGLCVITVILHTLEAAYAGKVCHDRELTSGATVKWVISTFFFGFSSLTLRLLPYKPDQKRFEDKRKK
ncbi:transmembrane protein 254-like [Biomphalaria glabrata]|uniref:Transmembrane protein 254 n=1 Tax=Biomphalaria glabrata TaxID=6526 RepID=A0A9W2YZV9_BIOGL|nr:transmembrane protein 254-like [Biomphalaria glabrata]